MGTDEKKKQVIFMRRAESVKDRIAELSAEMHRMKEALDEELRKDVAYRDKKLCEWYFDTINDCLSRIMELKWVLGNQ